MCSSNFSGSPGFNQTALTPSLSATLMLFASSSNSSVEARVMVELGDIETAMSGGG